MGVTIPGTAFLACSDETVAAPTPADSNTTVTNRPVLPIPERLEGSIFALDMRPGEREFLPGLRTPTKGYNGDYLGPTLVVRSGSDVTLNVTNGIGVTSTTHWHGMHVPAVMDGGPTRGSSPGKHGWPRFRCSTAPRRTGTTHTPTPS